MKALLLAICLLATVSASAETFQFKTSYRAKGLDKKEFQQINLIMAQPLTDASIGREEIILGTGYGAKYEFLTDNPETPYVRLQCGNSPGTRRLIVYIDGTAVVSKLARETGVLGEGRLAPGIVGGSGYEFDSAESCNQFAQYLQAISGQVTPENPVQVRIDDQAFHQILAIFHSTK